ncbi:MAG: lipopolysaccharide heptosyltransferase I [Nitrospina sp.]|nr:lipopolysaccharide heptosyltransferase I [Nitrospina sp.]
MVETPAKILIVKLSSLGDLAHALPVLCALRKRFPESHIAWAVESKFSDFIKGHPDLNEVIEVPTQKWRRKWTPKSFAEIWQLIRTLRESRYDLVLDLQGLIKSSILTGFSGSPKRLGFHRRDCREPLSAWACNLRAERTRHIPHVVDKNLALLKPLGIGADSPGFNLGARPEALAYIDEQLHNLLPAGSPKPVALHAGVGYPTKAWPLERFAALADRIRRELEVPVLLTWGPGDRDRAETIRELMEETGHLAPETASLQQALALYTRIRLFISGDTGPLHLCAALEVPTVSIYGPTDPARNGPYGPAHEVVMEPQPCSFCFKRSCPTDTECMQAVDVDRVFEAVHRRLHPAAGATAT